MDQSTRYNIEDLIVIIWQRRWTFLLAMVLSMSLPIAWAFLAVPIYRVSATLLPRQSQSSGGGVQSLLGQFAGPAQLLGLNVGLPVNAQEAIALLKSRAVFDSFATEHNLLPVLFSGQWNKKAGKWKTTNHIPTMQDAWRLFNDKVRSVSRNKDTGIVTLQISWNNRVEAANWANQLVTLVNNMMRQRALAVAKSSLASLRVQYYSASSIELRNAIARLMEAQINKEALAKAQPDYAFTVISAAQVPDANKFASPRRKLLLIVAFPFGVIIGVICVLLSDAWGSLRASLKTRFSN